jgi:hypothetical protein
MSLAPLLRGTGKTRIAAKDVFMMGHGLKVLWIYAPMHPALMINL